MQTHTVESHAIVRTRVASQRNSLLTRELSRQVEVRQKPHEAYRTAKEDRCAMSVGPGQWPRSPRYLKSILFLVFFTPVQPFSQRLAWNHPVNWVGYEI